LVRRGRPLGLFQNLVEREVDGDKFSLNLVLEGFNVGIDGSSFISHSLDGLFLLFGFILQVNDLLVVSGGHLGMRGSREEEWVHEKK
jgi:hypothetical protein